MALKKFRDSKGRECYGVCCEDVERHSKVLEVQDDLRKSAPTVLTFDDPLEHVKVTLEAIEASFAKQTEAKPAGPRFQVLRTGGESQLIIENGVPVAKAMGHNPARNPENVRKFFGPGSEHSSTREGDRFVPGGLEKQETALELLKTARANPMPFEPIS